jgi:predicted transcriptional regulator
MPSRMYVQPLHCLGRLTEALFTPILNWIEVPLNSELQEKLNRVAAENNSGAEEYVRQLVEYYLDHDQWFRQQVKKGLGQLDRGEFVSHEEIGTRLDQMFRS